MKDTIELGPQGEPLFRPSQVNPYRILAEAYWLAAQSGLSGWTITLDDDPVLAGSCTHETRTITLSKRWMYSWDYARDTVLHEIAHALQLNHHGVAHESVLADIKRRFPN